MSEARRGKEGGREGGEGREEVSGKRDGRRKHNELRPKETYLFLLVPLKNLIYSPLPQEVIFQLVSFDSSS